MTGNILDVLKERGFIEQCTDEEELRKLLEEKSVKFYIGFDATADSLTIGHFLTVMAMMHMQRAGHIPIALLGGGTTMIGDPSGKSDMRSMMTRETINHNADCFYKQLSRFLDFSNGKAILVNNADWLLDMNYVDMLREVGTHFTVNRMLAADCYKQRWDRGLTFFEFNYMIMQSYDFYRLYKDLGCQLEMGGNDQWSNIIGGVELVRRKEGAAAYGLTLKLLTTSDGTKMGKTMKGAIWLDANKTSPYEFFQYLRNIEDAKVEECLSLLTFLPMDEVRRLGALEGAEINRAKEVLAFEVTKLVHGEEEAIKAQNAAREVFARGGLSEDMPTLNYSPSEIEEGIDIIKVLSDAKLVKSNSEARRLISEGGVSLNSEKVIDPYLKLSKESFDDNGSAVLKKGKKTYYKITIE